MKISGQNTIDASVEQVWEALLDPNVLVATIPGCERLEATGENAYSMTVSAGVAAIRGTYTGSCILSDLKEPESLTMRIKGAGAPGTIDAAVAVRFAGEGERTSLTYDADAVVGGMIGGVGQRMLTSVSRRMAAEFFGNVERTIASGPPTSSSAVGGAAGGTADAVAAAPSPTGAMSAHQHGATAAPSRMPSWGGSFPAGVAVGGALALAGVIVGGILGRRR